MQLFIMRLYNGGCESEVLLSGYLDFFISLYGLGYLQDSTNVVIYEVTTMLVLEPDNKPAKRELF